MRKPTLLFDEVPCVAIPASVEELDAEGYLISNPDVRRSGMDPRAHFLAHGQAEGREHWINSAEVSRIRAAQLARARFRRAPARVLPNGTLDHLSAALRREFAFPDDPPVYTHPYWPSLIAEFRANPDKLYLDVGAGQQRVYYGNVVNAEIFVNASTDVLCVGEDLPFADASFDGVFAFSVLEHTLRPWQVAAEMLRVLRPGGRLIVEWPFMQGVHGMPHHYYNATPEGHRRMFAGGVEVEHFIVGEGGKPIFGLWWLLATWANGLGAEDAARFRALTVADLLGRPPEQQLAESYCANLSPQAEWMIPSGTTLIGTRKNSSASPVGWLRRWLRR